VAEVPAPVSRDELDAIARALQERNWTLVARHEPSREPVKLPDLRHLRVLAVDDTAVNREVLAEALGSFKIVPELAATGAEAIERVNAAHFDFVFMDCSMPGMDGYEATARIRALEAELGRTPARIVALTAHVTGEDARRWRDSGMDGYVAKPFTMAQIRSVLMAGESTEEAPTADPNLAMPLLSPDTLAMFNSLSGTEAGRLAHRVFGLFLVHAPTALENLQRAIENDAPEVDKLAHALKSMCLSAGAAQAAAHCGAIERQAREGRHFTEGDLQPIVFTLATTSAAMRQHLQMSSVAASA